MKQKLLTLVLLLTALCMTLCGCTAQDVTLPAQVDMVPGTTLTLADLAEYTGPDLSGEDLMTVLLLVQESGGEAAFRFASEAPEVAAVSEDGTLTAKSVGQTAVTVSCPALDYEQVLLVNVWDYATGLKTETALLLQPGDTAPLNTVVEGANSPLTVAYMSDDPAVAAVDENGLVTAVADGETVVRASLPGSSLAAECRVTVGQAVQSISLSSAAAQLEPGQRMKLDAAVWPALGQPVTFASGDDAVATVDADGTVRAKAPGTVRITASAGGHTAACVVTVAGETATPETATPETATPETATPETATTETATPETATPETATPETATPETASPETASPETALTEETEQFDNFFQRLASLFGLGG